MFFSSSNHLCLPSQSSFNTCLSQYVITCFQRLPTGWGIKDGHFTDQATVNWCAFMSASPKSVCQLVCIHCIFQNCTFLQSTKLSADNIANIISQYSRTTLVLLFCSSFYAHVHTACPV